MEIIKFSATWCGPCKQLSNVLDNEVFDNIDITEVDIDKERDRTQALGIRSVPTLIVMDGDKEIQRITGAKTKNELVELLGL